MIGLLLAGVASATDPNEVTVVSFAPVGDARGAEQATLTFSAAMVAFGKPEAAAPATTDCGAGAGRWLDDRTWSWRFDQPVAAGADCQFVLRYRLRSLAGTRVRGERSYPVRAGTAAISTLIPSAGSTIDADQIFVARLDGPFDTAQLDGASCIAAGITERLPVRAVTGADRDAVLAGMADEYWEYRALTGLEADSTAAADRAEALSRRTDIATFTCGRSLPADVSVRLTWAPKHPADDDLRSPIQHFNFKVRSNFSARIACQRVNPRSDCMPLGGISVRFSAPVPVATARAIRLQAPDGKLLLPAALSSDSRITVDAVAFPGPFTPETEYTVVLPDDVTDDAGRRLANADRFPLPVRMDAPPPLARFAAAFGILERHADPALPVTLRDVEGSSGSKPPSPVAHDNRQHAKSLPGPAGTPDATGSPPAITGLPGRVFHVADPAEIMPWLQRLDQSPDPAETLFTAEDATRRLTIPRQESTGETEVVGIPLPEPGLHVVELASPRLGARLLDRATPYHVRAAALVTNLAIHVKEGAANSLVWVTRLDDGQPAAGATVTVRDCHNTAILERTTDTAGLVRISANELPDDLSRCDGWWRGWLFTAQRGDDMTFGLSEWSEGLGRWDFGLPWYSSALEGIAAHTVFDRTLLRAGETLGMKVFLRARSSEGLTTPDSGLTREVLISNNADQEWVLPVTFEHGAATLEWTVPREAPRGRYTVRVRRNDEEWGFYAGDFSVADFRLPTQRATVQLPGEPLIAPDTVPVDLSVTFLAGGGAAGTPVEVRSRTETWSPSFADFPDHSFSGQSLVAGIERFGANDGPAVEPAQLLPLTLDDAGGARADVAVTGEATVPRRLVVEMEYPDANGERLTTAQAATVWPAATLVGLRADPSPRSGEPFAVEAVTIAPDGAPVGGQSVIIEGWTRDWYSWRRRLVGGFYAYDGGVETRSLGELCRGTSDANGRLSCTLQLADSDRITLVARVSDAIGRTATASQTVWLLGRDTWFGGQDSDRMDLVPEQAAYQPGDTATLRAELPFRTATALVTVEREGVLDAWVQPLAASSPEIEVPITRAHAPNVYVSVLAVRGRVKAPGPTAVIDLGRPAFRMGVAELEIGRDDHALTVAVLPAATLLAPRDRARVTVEVARANGAPLPAEAEIAFVAVDAALLELQENESWDLLTGMVRPGTLEVATSTGLGRVIGRRHYGRKALPAGGGGGLLPTRELFEPRLIWLPRVALDAEGRATIEVPLNDALTEFRLVAIANAGTDLFGTGSATIRTHRDLMLFAGLPAVVRTGDKVVATAIVRNAASGPVTARISAEAATADGSPVKADQAPAEINLAAGEAHEFAIPITVPDTTQPLSVRFTAVAGAGADQGTRDAVETRVQVLPASGTPSTWQAALLQLAEPKTLPLAEPSDALPGSTRLAVDLSPTLLGGLSGVRDTMTHYPFTCLEQRASRAIALSDAAGWQAVSASLSAHIAADGLATYFPGMRTGSPELSAYLITVADAAGWELPEAPLASMLQALEPWAAGAQSLRTGGAGSTLLMRLRALDALARHGRVQPTWMENLDSTPETWPTTALLDSYSILQRAPQLPRRAERLDEIRQLLRNRLDLTGTSLVLRGEEAALFPWLLSTSDLDAVRLLLLVADDPAFAGMAARLARGTLARQQHGAWDSTIANAWGTLALQRYAAIHEPAAVGGVTTIEASGQAPVRHDWTDASADSALTLPMAAATQALTLSHVGTGAPYALVRAMATIPLRQPVDAGFSVTKTLEPIRQSRSDGWSRGDLVRVRLDIEAHNDATWVALDDPLPTGATLLDGRLRRGSIDLAGSERNESRLYPSFVDVRAEAYRAYFAAVPRGRWQVEYVVRLNTAGTFGTPATRVEAMYEADRFGASPNAVMVVQPTP